MLSPARLRALLVGCAGFLVAILWMDLMFDVQAIDATPAGMESIAAYYRRATVGAWRMNWLVAVVMLVMLALLAVQVRRSRRGAAHTTVLVVSIAAPIALALARVLPQAQRLGAGEVAAADQVGVAREILVCHVGCLAAVILFIALQLLGEQEPADPSRAR